VSDDSITRSDAGADLTLTSVTKRFGTFTAVDDLDLVVEQGRFFALLGPSGCGKTTALRALAGLEEVDSGRVLVGGRDLTHVPANKRDMGMVFQAYSLFPNLTAAQNVEFGLRVRGRQRADRQRRVAELLEIVGLSHAAGRYPHQLSGGMQQRVGLARALAVDPQVLLFDEPFSALDPLIRRDMQNEVRRLHEEVGKTMIFITHDLQEALKLGDRILIMRDGEVVQIGSPAEVVANPADDYVRDFVSDVPRSHVLTLRYVVRDPRPGESLDGPVMQANCIVRDAARQVLHSALPVRVYDGDRFLGVVDDDDILRVVVAEEAAGEGSAQ